MQHNTQVQIQYLSGTERILAIFSESKEWVVFYWLQLTHGLTTLCDIIRKKWKFNKISLDLMSTFCCVWQLTHCWLMNAATGKINIHICLFQPVELCPLMAAAMYEKLTEVRAGQSLFSAMCVCQYTHSSLALGPPFNPVSCLPSLLSPFSLSLNLPSFVFFQEHEESSGGVDGWV